MVGAFVGVVPKCAQALVPLMFERQAGSIVNVASVLGLRSQKAVAAYCTSKAGVLHLTRTMAMELAGASGKLTPVIRSAMQLGNRLMLRKLRNYIAKDPKLTTIREPSWSLVPVAKCGLSRVGPCHHSSFSAPPPPRFWRVSRRE